MHRADPSSREVRPNVVCRIEYDCEPRTMKGSRHNGGGCGVRGGKVIIKIRFMELLNFLQTAVRSYVLHFTYLHFHIYFT